MRNYITFNHKHKNPQYIFMNPNRLVEKSLENHQILAIQ